MGRWGAGRLSRQGISVHASSGYDTRASERTRDARAKSPTPADRIDLTRDNGITVRLLWSRATNLVTVAVDDVASDDHFEFILDEDEAALEVFNHPFAHAAARGLEFPTRRAEPETLRDAA